MTSFAPLLQAFFTERLISQRNASGNTIRAYRDTFRLLLTFAATSTGKRPSALAIDDIDAPLVGAFLDHLEHDRGNQARTRNHRLAAIHSLSPTRRPGTPTMPRRFSGSSRSRPSDGNRTWSATSLPPRSTRCWRPPTGPPGPGDAITPCWC